MKIRETFTKTEAGKNDILCIACEDSNTIIVKMAEGGVIQDTTQYERLTFSTIAEYEAYKQTITIKKLEKVAPFKNVKEQ